MEEPKKLKNEKMKKLLLLLFTLFTLTSCVDFKPSATIDDFKIDLHIDDVEGLEGEWVISTQEEDDVITIKIERKEELSE